MNNQLWRHSATNAIIEFLQDESNQELVTGLSTIFQRHSDLDRELAVRNTVLGQLGVIPLEPGAKLGLMVRFIELGLSLVDWGRVIRDLKLDSESEGEAGV